MNRNTCLSDFTAIGVDSVGVSAPVVTQPVAIEVAEEVGEQKFSAQPTGQSEW